MIFTQHSKQKKLSVRYSLTAQRLLVTVFFCFTFVVKLSPMDPPPKQSKKDQSKDQSQEQPKRPTSDPKQKSRLGVPKLFLKSSGSDDQSSSAPSSPAKHKKHSSSDPKSSPRAKKIDKQRDRMCESIWSCMALDEKIEKLIGNEDRHGKSLLILSLCNDDIEMFTKLLAHPQVNVNHKDNYGNTALFYAVISNKAHFFWPLCIDTRVNSLFYNDERRLVQNVCDKRDNEMGAKFYNFLFARGAVERTIDNLMIEHYHNIDDYLSQEGINTLLKETWQILEKDSKHLLEPFVEIITNDFIRSMIKARINDPDSVIIFVVGSLKKITEMLLAGDTIFTLGYHTEKVRDVFIQTCTDRILPEISNDFIAVIINPLIFNFMAKDLYYLKNSMKQCIDMIALDEGWSLAHLTDDQNKSIKSKLYDLYHNCGSEPIFAIMINDYINYIITERLASMSLGADCIMPINPDIIR